MDYMLGNQECSSGCESGWTLYLQHSSSISPDASFDREHDSPDSRGNRVFTKRSNKEDEDEDEEDEDLSMVSDASSGPPHLHEEEGYGIGGGNGKNCFYPYAIDEVPSSSRNINNLTKKKNRENHKRIQQHSSLLDDTASSPFLDFCNKTRSQTSVENVVEYSQGYSTTQFEVRPPFQEEHYDFFQSGNQLQQQNHRWFEGKRW